MTEENKPILDEGAQKEFKEFYRSTLVACEIMEEFCKDFLENSHMLVNSSAEYHQHLICFSKAHLIADIISDFNKYSSWEHVDNELGSRMFNFHRLIVAGAAGQIVIDAPTNDGFDREKTHKHRIRKQINETI
jgi:hypothetical protein